ncbi:EAL domain-containing protein [Sulfurimonas sp.]|nr:EAL domain-containing protein [Sulfurimonas sp.]
MEAINIDLSHLIFEITEYELMMSENSPLESLNKLAENGFRFHLDDFGTGYSSITYLHHLPVESIKIDKSFIDEITPENDNKLLVDAIIDMSKALDLTITAEGVESEYQYNYLKDKMCETIQGYYFSRPLNVSDFEKYNKKFHTT